MYFCIGPLSQYGPAGAAQTLLLKDGTTVELSVVHSF